MTSPETKVEQSPAPGNKASRILSRVAYICFLIVGVSELVLAADPGFRGEELGAIGWLFFLFFYFPVFIPSFVAALITSIIRQLFGLEGKLLLLSLVTVVSLVMFMWIPLPGFKYNFVGLFVSGSVTLVLCVSQWMMGRKR